MKLFYSYLSSAITSPFLLQVNLFQKYLFLRQQTHNMTKDFSWQFHEQCFLSYFGLIDAKIKASDKDLPGKVS